MARRPRTQQQRPYIRDAGRPFDGPVDVATAGIGMVLLALAVGFAIGFLVFLLMSLVNWLTTLLWGVGGEVAGVPWYSLAVCALGGLVIGLWTWYSRSRVEGLETVMGEFKATGTYRLRGGVGKSAVSFLLPLVFGGSVGFEAGLTGIITAACCWIRDRLKAAGLREMHIADVTIAASFSAIFGAPIAGIVAGAESAPKGGDVLEEPSVNDYDMRRGVKVVLYTTAAIGAFAGIRAGTALFGGNAGLPHFDSIQAVAADLLWVVPCLVVAYVMALVYHASRVGTARLATRMGNGQVGTILKPVIAGVAIGAIAMAFPLVLFPGEEQSHELMATWSTWTAVALLATGVLKAAATPLCINMGWMGGNFFPSIFAGVACGYGLAALTGADPMLMVTVVATGFLAGVTRKPLLTLAILALCFPLDGILWSGLAAVIGAALPLPRMLRVPDAQLQRRPRMRKVNDDA